MPHPDHSPSPSGRDAARIIRPVLEAFLGKTGLRVLEYHLEKLLQKDPYEALCSDPHSFYLAMRNLFGQGADIIIQTMAKKMMDENILDARDPNELLDALKDQREGRKKLLKILRLHDNEDYE